MMERYLEDLEARIDPGVEEALLDEWRRFLEGRWTDGIFSPRRARPAPARVAWPSVRVNEALADPERMVLQQLAGCSAALAEGSGAILNARANFGCGILSSVFGAEVFLMEEAFNTLPSTRPLAGGMAAVRRLLDRGVPGLTTGYGGSCLAMGRFFTETFRPYPRLARYVHIYHPDLQGPMDIAELLCGSDLFLALVEEADTIHALLALVTETYRRFMTQWLAQVPGPADYTTHWGLLQKGRLMLRDDSAMNLSPAMFETFIKPYDQALLADFGGGAIHFCGRGDHYIHHLAAMPGVHAVNLSQPEHNDMERIFRHTVDRGINLLGLNRDAAASALARGRDLRGRVHCW